MSGKLVRSIIEILFGLEFLEFGLGDFCIWGDGTTITSSVFAEGDPCSLVLFRKVEEGLVSDECSLGCELVGGELRGRNSLFGARGICLKFEHVEAGMLFLRTVEIIA